MGIARYVRDAHDRRAVEIAVTVADDWQGRGLGTELVAQLSDRARQEGIRYFTALVSADNVAIAGLLRNVSAELVRRGPGTVEYEIALAPEIEHGSRVFPMPASPTITSDRLSPRHDSARA